MIRDRFALGVLGVTVAALPVFGLLARMDNTRRSADSAVLWLAGAAQLVLLLAWVFIPRLPKWIVAGWGLILVATGIGIVIAGPIAAAPELGSLFPWALLGLVVLGVVTMLMAVVHSGSSSPPA